MSFHCLFYLLIITEKKEVFMHNTSIDFTSFTQTILKNLQKKLGSNYKVFSHCVRKNNGVELTGVVAKRIGRSASPTIYINSYFKNDITKEEVEKISNDLFQEFQAAEFETDLDLSDFAMFERAQKRLAFKLIHAEKNKELLKTVPHKRFHNLAIVFYYTVAQEPFHGKATILVHNSHMEKWGAKVEELLEIAFQNTPLLYPSTITNMADVMKEILSEGLRQDISDARLEESGELFDENWIEELIDQMSTDIGREKIPMYVLTNKKKLYGAACMLYPKVLKNFSEKLGQDFYILPSSVHEVILVPVNSEANQESLREIVTDINRTQVAEEEILADSVYFYNRTLDKILWLS